MRLARTRMPRFLRPWPAVLLALLLAAPAFATSGYSLHALPELPGDDSSDAFGVSDDRPAGGGAGGSIWICGRSSSGGVAHAVVWNTSSDLGSSSATPLTPVSPGATNEARQIRCADGSCRAVGTEGAEGAGQAPVLWSYEGSSWNPPVSLTCPAQSQPATSDVGRTRGVVITIQGSNFGNTACGACDVTQGAVGAVQQAMVWEEQPGGSWTPVPLPGLSALPERSSEATAIFDLPADTERLVAAGWAEDDLGTRQPVIWERGQVDWSITPLPLPPGSRGGQVASGDFGEAGHAFVLDGSMSQDDGTVQAYIWRQVSGPPGQPATWEGQVLSPLPGYDGGSARAVAGRRGASRQQTLAASFNVIGSSSSNGGLAPETTLWEVYPLTVETYEFRLTVRDLPGNVTNLDIVSSVRGPSSGGHSGARLSVGTATSSGPLARGGAAPEGVPTENHAVVLLQLEPAPGLMPAGLVAALMSLATIGAVALAMRRRKVVA